MRSAQANIATEISKPNNYSTATPLQRFSTVVLKQGGVKKFPGGESPYAPYNVDSLIKKFNNE